MKPLTIHINKKDNKIYYNITKSINELYLYVGRQSSEKMLVNFGDKIKTKLEKSEKELRTKLKYQIDDKEKKSY